MKNAQSFLLALFVTGLSAAPLSAGWGHHHRHHGGYYQAAAYYQAPAAPQYFMMPAQQSAPSFREFIDAAREIADLTRGRRGGLITSSDDSSGIESKLSEIKSELATFRRDLTEAVENANSQLERHGKEIVTLRLDVEELKSRQPNDNSEAISQTINDVQAKVGTALSRIGGFSKKEATDVFNQVIEEAVKDLNAADQAKVRAKLQEIVNREIEKVYK